MEFFPSFSHKLLSAKCLQSSLHQPSRPRRTRPSVSGPKKLTRAQTKPTMRSHSIYKTNTQLCLFPSRGLCLPPMDPHMGAFASRDSPNTHIPTTRAEIKPRFYKNVSTQFVYNAALCSDVANGQCYFVLCCDAILVQLPIKQGPKTWKALHEYRRWKNPISFFLALRPCK